MSFIKAHPVPIGIGVVIVLVIVVSSSGGSSSGNSGELSLKSQALQNAANEKAMAANSQIAGINAAAGVSLGQQSVEKYKVSEAAALSRTDTAMRALATFVGADSQRAIADKGSLLATTQAAFSHASNIKASQDKLDLGTLVVNSEITKNADTLAAQITLATNDNNFKLNAIGKQTQGDLSKLVQVGMNSNSLEQIKNTGMLDLARQNGNTATEIQRMGLQSTEAQLGMTLGNTINMQRNALLSAETMQGGMIAGNFAGLMATLNSNETVAGMNIGSTERMQGVSLSAAMDALKTNIAGNFAVETYRGSLLPSILGSQENIARIGGDTTLGVAEIGSRTALGIAAKQQEAAIIKAKGERSGGWLKTIGSIIGSFF